MLKKSVVVRLIVPVHAEQVERVIYAESDQCGLIAVFVKDRRLFRFGEDVVLRISAFKTGTRNQFKTDPVLAKLRDVSPCVLKYVLEILEDIELFLFLQDVVLDFQEFQ